MLCESLEGGDGCNAQLEPCMGTNRERHAERMQRMTLEAQSAPGGRVAQVDPSFSPKSSPCLPMKALTLPGEH